MKVGGGGGEETTFLSSPPPPRSFTCAIFRAVFDSCSSFFAPKPHGNACYAGYAGIFPLNYRSDTRHLNISQPISNGNILLLCVVSARGISVKLKEYSVKSASLFPSFALFSLPPPLSFLRLPRRLRFTCDTDRPLNLQTETRY